MKRLRVTAGDAAHRELTIADELAGKNFEHVLAVLDSGEDAESGGYYVSHVWSVQRTRLRTNGRTVTHFIVR
jgi:hypothetical protein